MTESQKQNEQYLNEMVGNIKWLGGGEAAQA